MVRKNPRKLSIVSTVMDLNTTPSGSPSEAASQSPGPSKISAAGNAAALKRFLLFPAGGIGDTIQFTPVVRNLKKSRPGVEITVVAGSNVSKEVFSGSPYVDRVYVLENRSHSGWMSFLLKLRLEVGSFDAILAVAGIPVYSQWILRPRLVVAFSDRPGGIIGKRTEWSALTRNLSLNEVHECLRLLDPLGLENCYDETDLFMSDTDKGRVSSIWEEADLNDRYPVFTVHSGCDTIEKQWRESSFARLIRALMEFYPQSSVVFIGGPGEDVGGIIDLAGDRTRLVDLTGRTTLLQSAAVVQRSHLMISNDSSTAHIAASVNTPVVTLFGPSDPRRVKPWNPRGIVRVIAAGLECSPCYQLYSGRIWCRFGEEDIRCMNAITPDVVLREVKTMIDITGAPMVHAAGTDSSADTT